MVTFSTPLAGKIYLGTSQFLQIYANMAFMLPTLQNDIHQPNNSNSEPKLCFILGICQRSGTNYLFRLTRQHPDCMGPGPIWEDFFVQNSELLKRYTSSVSGTWNPNWDVQNKLGPQEVLLRYFGDAIGRLLRLQITKDTENQATTNEETRIIKSAKILLTKTPSVVGIENIFDLFPEAYLILIYRDGRAVVESGVRSFDWHYEEATRKWSDGAQAILDLQAKYHNSNKKILLLKFENLFTNEKTELYKVFNFLGVDANKFDYDGAKNLGITGSSETREQTDSVHWKVTQKEKNFNPIVRFSNWDGKKHDRFNWIAGRYMSKLGYDLEVTKTNRHLYVLRNRLLDSKWTLRTISFYYINYVKRKVYAVKQICLSKFCD